MAAEDHTGGNRTVAAVLGANVHRLRGGHTSADLARCAQGWGLKWTTGTVANVESGRSSPTVTTIYLLALALADLTGEPVTPAQLFDGKGTVSVPGGEIELRLLQTTLSTEAPRRPPKAVAKTIADAQRAWIEENWATWPDRLQKLGGRRIHKTKLAMQESDVRIGNSLGLDKDRTAAEMTNLWDRPLSAVRDERAGPDANAQARGQVSRQLKAQLAKVVTDGDD